MIFTPNHNRHTWKSCSLLNPSNQSISTTPSRAVCIREPRWCQQKPLDWLRGQIIQPITQLNSLSKCNELRNLRSFSQKLCRLFPLLWGVASVGGIFQALGIHTERLQVVKMRMPNLVQWPIWQAIGDGISDRSPTKKNDWIDFLKRKRKMKQYHDV